MELVHKKTYQCKGEHAKLWQWDQPVNGCCLSSMGERIISLALDFKPQQQ